MRAIWKARLQLADMSVPVKLYSAVQDRGRGVSFRLLHEPDLVPLRQRMINPRTGHAVERGEERRGLEIEPGVFVVLRSDELDELEPGPSREVRVSRFVPAGSFGFGWYDRPYHLGPDRAPEAYAAFVEALARTGREGLARWVMRRKEYHGIVRAYRGRLLLVTLRHAGSIISPDELEAPAGRALDARERKMAEQFVAALSGEFDVGEYRNETRARILELVERKRRGEAISIPEREEKRAPAELAGLLEESLARIGAA